ncbi:S8 family peptidase [Baekduia alba]|uniref:S8 family peptidase n=1 Tax=Baekduia alba TaxID=2997333 RepID=UPI002341669C|nr:S8/S53 family peptidase [Baekduia alba]
MSEAPGSHPRATSAAGHGRRIFRALGSGLLLALAVAFPAHAEEVFTGQAAAARATDSTWIPAPARRAAVCIVDTGNDVTPDTANVVARFATDGGTGADLNAGKHGTLMAMIASAPHDGFGMVGAAPSIDVVSVRASSDGTSFGGFDVQAAVQTCMAKRAAYNIKVVSLSLGGDIGGIAANTTQRNAFQDMIDNARLHGLNVVAAAGNGATGTVDWPAGYPPAFAVGAAANDGARCGFASWGPELDLWAPGCPLDVARPDATGNAAWASGSSEATAFVAGILTQLRGLDPGLGVDAAEQVVRANARSTAAGPYLDVAAAFTGAGFAPQLAAGHDAVPAPIVTTPSTASLEAHAPTTVIDAPAPEAAPPSSIPEPARIVPSDGQQRSRLGRPVVRSLTVRRGTLTLVLKGKPKGIEARVEVYARKRGGVFPTLARSVRIRADHLRTRVSGTLNQVSIIYRDPTGVREASAPLIVHPRT